MKWIEWDEWPTPRLIPEERVRLYRELGRNLLKGGINEEIPDDLAAELQLAQEAFEHVVGKINDYQKEKGNRPHPAVAKGGNHEGGSRSQEQDGQRP